MRKKIVYSLVMLLLSLGVLTTAAAAWFTPTEKYINNIIFTAGTVEVSGALFKAADFDLDGELDIVGGANVYTPVQQLVITDMKPGDVYSYRLDVTNIGGVAGDLEVYFDGADEGLKDVLTFGSVVKDGEGQEIQGAGALRTRLATTQVFAAVSELAPSSTSQNAQISVYFHITFETLEQLKILDAETFSDKQDLNDYKNLSFSIAKIIVELTQAA